MKAKAISLLAGLLFGGLAGAQSADQSPNYQDTVNWILAKVGQLGGHVVNIGDGWDTVTFSNFAIQNCTLSFEKDTTTPVFDRVSREHETSYQNYFYTIPMSGIAASATPNNYGGGSWTVFLSTTTQSIHIQGSSDIDGMVDKNIGGWDAASLDFGQPNSDHADIAPRMAKALNHLAQLCKQPTNNEPF